MRRNSLACRCAVALLFAVGAGADTVVLKSGLSVDGEVVTVNANCIAVKSGGGQILYQMDEIDRIEKNAKKGTVDFARHHPAALHHERMLEEKTGLNAAQREKVIALVDHLAREDANERNQALKQLVALQKQFDVYRFLKESRQGFGARVLPGVLEAMLAINPSETKPIILETLTDQVPVLRAAALDLLGRHRGLASVETIARGVADADVEVRIAAINALGQAGDRRSTPVLIAMLTETNPRLRNAGRSALQSLWRNENHQIDAETAEEWRAFWEQSRAGVARPIELTLLEPLYVQPPNTYVLAHE